MALTDLTALDAYRLLRVAGDLVGDHATGLSGIFDALRAASAPAEATEDSREDPFVGFRNPPAPFAQLEQLRMLGDRYRAAVVERYGDAYAAELWARVRRPGASGG